MSFDLKYALIFFTASTVALNSAVTEKPEGLWCKIDGQETKFQERVVVHSSSDGMITISGDRSIKEFLWLKVPKADAGTQTLKNEPKLD